MMGQHRRKFVIICLCGLTTLVFLSYVLNISPSKRVVAINPSADELKYLQIQSAYHSTLAKQQKQAYGPSAKYIQYGKVFPNRSSLVNDLPNNVKRILLWTPFFGAWDYIPENIFISGNRSCVRSSDKKDLNKSDAIIFHARDLGGLDTLPKFRLPSQRWVYFVMESPYATGITVSKYQGIFNWTATYRRDADFPAMYLNMTQMNEPMTDSDFAELEGDIFDSKKKLVAFMNSNCKAKRTNRLQYIRELQQYIPVDLYGGCGWKNCPRESELCNKTMSEYKFYLAMENSHCRDYVTEKARQPLLEWQSVPVVMGADHPATYSELLPPDSFIHTAGFSSPQDLAKYLLFLNNNKELYLKYHSWRKTHQVSYDLFWTEQLCVALHNHSLPSQVYTDFAGWYNEDNCKTGTR